MSLPNHYSNLELQFFEYYLDFELKDQYNFEDPRISAIVKSVMEQLASQGLEGVELLQNTHRCIWNFRPDIFLDGEWVTFKTAYEQWLKVDKLLFEDFFSRGENLAGINIDGIIISMYGTEFLHHIIKYWEENNIVEIRGDGGYPLIRMNPNFVVECSQLVIPKSLETKIQEARKDV